MATIPAPHPKQLDVINSPQRYKVLAWGRRCIEPEGLVTMIDGTKKAIKNIVVGDLVVSVNINSELVGSRILNVYSYGSRQDPKPMIKFVYEGKTYKTTYDHPFYDGERFYQLYQLIWRSLESTQQHRLAALCEQYGSYFEPELQSDWEAWSQACELTQRLQSDRDKSQEVQSSQTCSRDFYTKPLTEKRNKSHKCQQTGQQGGQSGVGDKTGEHDSCEAARAFSYSLRAKSLDGKVKRISSEKDERASPKEWTIGSRLFKDSREKVSNSNSFAHLSYFKVQNLEVSTLEILESEETFDIEVEDNGCFFYNDLLVHNTGKSVLAGLVTFTEAMKHQGNYYIVAPTERQAKSIYWNDILRIVIPKELADMCKINQVERTITFPHIKGDITLPDGKTIHVEHDENKPPSTISLRGVDNPDALRGVKLAGCVLDEYAFMDNAKYVFDTIISPALGDQEGWAIFISSPNGVHNPFYDLAQTAQKDTDEYFFSHATALDNPFFPKREFERQRIRYASEGKTEAFTQEWEAEFKTPKLLIYKAFDREIHVKKHSDIDISPLNTFAMGIDFGWIDPFATVFAMIDQNNDWYIIDEIYQSELTTDKAHRLLLDRMGDKTYSRIIGDAQAKTDIANFKERRFYITPSSKGSGSINEGIREVASYLELRETVRNGKTADRPKLYISDRCTNLIKEFESYSNRTDAYGEPIDTPEDKNNHLLDALRYLITDYTRSRAPIHRRKRQYDPVTGRSLN